MLQLPPWPSPFHYSQHRVILLHLGTILISIPNILSAVVCWEINDRLPAYPHVTWFLSVARTTTHPWSNTFVMRASPTQAYINLETFHGPALHPESIPDHWLGTCNFASSCHDFGAGEWLPAGARLLHAGKKPAIHPVMLTHTCSPCVHHAYQRCPIARLDRHLHL